MAVTHSVARVRLRQLRLVPHCIRIAMYVIIQVCSIEDTDTSQIMTMLTYTLSCSLCYVFASMHARVYLHR